MIWLKKGKEFLVGVSKQELKKMYDQEKNAKSKLRLLATLRRKDGNTLDEIAFFLEKPKTTIHDWLKRLENNGVGGLYDIKQKGNRRKLSEGQRKMLNEVLNESPEKQNLPFVMWTTKLVQYIIFKKYQVSYTPSAIWKLVKKMNFSLKVPRQEDKKANKKAQEKFKKKLKKKYNIILNLDSRSSVLTRHIL